MNTKIVFIMVGTTHTGNLGAAARAMKTMGFYELRLVDTCSHLSAEALARSSGANDVLQQAVKFDTLQSAIADCQIVVGTTARARQLAAPMLSCRDLAKELAQQPSRPDMPLTAAIVFGHERSGLSNESIERCTRLLRIPCNPDFSSLNLGSAVQVVAYELSQWLHSVPQGAPARMPGKWKGTSSISSDEENAAWPAEPERNSQGPVAAVAADQPADPEDQPASSEAMEYFYEHLDRIMVNTGFLDPDNPRLLRRRIRVYFERNRPSVSELSLFRGILSSTESPKNQ